MKYGKIFASLSIVCCIIFFTACTAQSTEKTQPEEDASLQSSSTPTEKTQPEEDVSPQSSSTPAENNAEMEDELQTPQGEDSNGDIASDPSSPVNPSKSICTGPSEGISVTSAEDQWKVVVRRSDLVRSEEIVIFDKTQIEKILAYIDGMFPSDYKDPPDTGGEDITVFITRNGNTEEYAFLEKEVDGYELAKNCQDPDVANTWYFAELGAYQYLSSLLDE